MKPHVLFLAGAAAMAATLASQATERPAAPTEAQIEVTFVDPEGFSDFRDSYFHTEAGQENLMDELRSHLQDLARRHLAAGQRLEVRFLDIDLAGDYEPWRGVGFDDIRIIKEIYPPRMTLAFRLLAEDGSVVAEGERKLSQLGYMTAVHFPMSDLLRHDKALLTDWMRREFRRAKK